MKNIGSKIEVVSYQVFFPFTISSALYMDIKPSDGTFATVYSTVAFRYSFITKRFQDINQKLAAACSRTCDFVLYRFIVHTFVPSFSKTH